MIKKSVDIILPVYNSKKYIITTVGSVIKQNYKYWNLIIIDDCSNDGTYKILKNFKKKYFNDKRIFLYRNSKNKGQAFTRNLGLKKSKSTFVAFIDSDDFWEKNKLRNQMQFMINNNYNFTYTDYKSLKKNNIIKIIKTPDYYNYKSFIRNTSIATSTMIIKKNIIDNVFFPLLKLCEDYYFKCQILKRTDAYKCPSVFSYYRIRENSLQSNRSKIFFAIWNINKYFNKMNFINNLISIFFISYNSLKKYGFR
jgi:glycosyltransferase involved in cell wall biosynthesis